MASHLHRKFVAAILSAAFAACSLGWGAPAAWAGDTQTRRFDLPDHGTLQLTVPASWRQEIQPRGKGLPATISFTAASGEDFQVMVTPIVPPQPGMPAPPLSAIRANLEHSLPGVRPHAVEHHIVIHSLKGKHVQGYYYSVTDKAPKPNEFRLMTQAEARADGIGVVMTVLSNDDSGKVRANALALLKSARHDASRQGSTTPPEQSIAISKVKSGYDVTVPVSKLILGVAEPHLEQAAGPQGGAASNPRYFFFRDRGRGLIVSGWFEPAARFPGLKTFWRKEVEAWKKNKLPVPRNVAFKKVDGWDAIAYDTKMPVAKATDGHIRAEWVQAGTWIDLHLSVTASLPSDKVRARLEDILKHLKVRVKKK